MVNGAKVWTSNAHASHYGIVLVRTSPVDPANRHAGMSQLLIDLSLPGITINPIRILDGGHHFNEVVFEDVVVPGDMLLGEEGNGWHQVTAELAFERSGPERFLSTYPLVAEFGRRVADSGDPAGAGGARPAVGAGAGAAADVAADRGGAGPRRAAQHPGRAGQGRRDDVRGRRHRGGPPGGRRAAVAGLARSAGAGRWPRRSCTRRATRCAAAPTRSCAGSWHEDWGCADELDQDLVVETVRGHPARHEPFDPTPERRWDAGLWGALAEDGLTGVGLPEEAGGSGGELADAVAIVRTLAAGAGAVPVAEQLLVAGPALVAAGLTCRRRTSRSPSRSPTR